MLVSHWCGDGGAVEEQQITHCIDLWRKKIVKSVRHEKKLLILTEIMLIKVWAKREVNNGSPMNASR